MLKIASYEIVAATENTHDSTLLQSTDLWRNIVEGKVFPNQVQKHLQALAYEKQGCATIACLSLTFRGYRHVKSCTPPTK